MNLATLWSYEKLRVTALLDDGGLPPEPTRAAGPGHLHHPSANGHGPLAIVDERGRGRTTSANAGPGASSSSSALSSSPPPLVRKKSSVFSRREQLFRQLLHESVVPSRALSSAAMATVTATAANEFALEYAERAPRRFVPSADAGAVSVAAAVAHPGSNAHAGTGEAADGKSPSRRRVSSIAAATAAGSTTTASLPGAATNNRRDRRSLDSPKATTTKSPITIAPIARRNARRHKGPEFSSSAFKPYVGDMFSTRGDYVEGMLYMSRMKRSHLFTFGHDGTSPWADPGSRHVLKDAVSSALSAAVAAAAAGSLGVVTGADVASVVGTSVTGRASFSANPSVVDVLADLPPEQIIQLKQRQRCSLTLSNWSTNPENARLMVQENVVEALILLCKAEDPVTRLNCVTALMNLSNVEDLRSIIVQQGAVKAVAEIVNDTEDKVLRTACAVTLCNLCCLDGGEETLVEDGAVSALSLLINEHPKVSGLCLSALFNLTCVAEPFPKIESVLKVFLTLASSTAVSSSVDRDEITAKAVCNLSNFKRIRLRLMEEGIVSAITNLIHPNHPGIQELLAYILLNLSAMRACRSELVAKGCMGALGALLGATAEVSTKHLLALALWNLSNEPGNRLRMVFEGLLLMITELCRGLRDPIKGELVRSVSAKTVFNVSVSEETRVKLVERDAVNVLSQLSRASEGGEAKKMCTLALCNLLSVQQAAADIVTAGAISALIQLSMAPNQTLETRHLFAKAMYGLCEIQATRDAVVKAGIIQAIIHLSSLDEETTTAESSDIATERQRALLSETRARCTAALACLAGDDVSSAAVCNVEVVRCVTKILVLERQNVAIERVCCSCLSLLCRDEQCSLLVAEEGAIEVVLLTCMESQDLQTKASCCHVLASMSCHPSCCMALVHMGVVSALATLARIKGDSAIQRCCAITLANLSSEKEIRGILVTAGTVKLLSLLSNSYSEDSQRDCAKVLCNMSCIPGQEHILVRDGAVDVLMMISMVRALQPLTKETCVRAFVNLLNTDTVDSLVSEGIVKILPALASLNLTSSPEIVSALYCKIICHPRGRDALCGEHAALRALFTLMSIANNTAGSEHALFEKLLSQLVYFEHCRERVVQAGLIDAVHKLASQTTDDAAPRDRRLALVLFVLAKHEPTRVAAASAASLSTIVTFLGRHISVMNDSEAGCVLYSVSTLCVLAWDEETRGRLEHADITSSLTSLLRVRAEGNQSLADASSSPSSHVAAPEMTASVKMSLLALCCLSGNEQHLQTMIQDHVIRHLGAILDVHGAKDCADDPEFVALAAILFRQLSHASSFPKLMGPATQQEVIRLFCRLASAVSKHGDQFAGRDVADALCSITFLPLGQTSPSKPPFVRRQSRPQLALRVATTSAVPSAKLISAEVLTGISALLTNTSQLEARWYCAAALFAMSCIIEYRQSLVRLGCSRILVNEASRGDDTSDLNILRCCAGALCNLTIVTGPTADSNASIMVQEGVVPALIQLAKVENDEIREYCTLALSNLSAQSPKVESGAVSALLSLSLRVTSSPTTSTGGVMGSVGVTRPPIVSDERYKLLASLPDYHLELEGFCEMQERKFECERHASKPPPPHLPVIVGDSEFVGEDRPHPDHHKHEAGKARSREESPGKRTSFDDGLTTSTPAAGPPPRDVDDAIDGWQSMSFPKVDPVESRALMSMQDDFDAGVDSTTRDDGDRADITNETSEGGGDGDPHQGALFHSVGRDHDARAEHDDSGKPRSHHAKAAVSLSPLARVVVRKTLTTNAARKFKDMRTRDHSGKQSHSTSSLPLATVEEQTGAEGGGGPVVKPLSSTGKSSSGGGNGIGSPSMRGLDRFGMLKSPSLGSLRPLSNNANAVEIRRDLAVPNVIIDDGAASPSASSIASAAAAARLYGLGGGSTLDLAFKPSPTPQSSIRSQPKAKTKRRQKPITTMPVSKASSSPTSHASNGNPTMDEGGVLVDAPTVMTLEDVQAQAKRLGLWC